MCRVSDANSPVRLSFPIIPLSLFPAICYYRDTKTVRMVRPWKVKEKGSSDEDTSDDEGYCLFSVRRLADGMRF